MDLDHNTVTVKLMLLSRSKFLESMLQILNEKQKNEYVYCNLVTPGWLYTLLNRPLCIVESYNKEILFFTDRAMDLPSPFASTAGTEKSFGHCTSQDTVAQ